MTKAKNLTLITALLLLTLVAGCSHKSAPKINFYSLQASSPVASDSVQGLPLSIGIGPIRLPQLLKRPHIVTRGENFQVFHAEFDRWSGDLQEEVSQILAESMARHLGTDQVTFFPWPKQIEPDWQVRVEILRLDGELGSAAYLEAHWVLIGKNREEVLTGSSRFKETLDSSSYATLVAAQNRLLTVFSKELSDRIRGLSRP